MIRGVTAESKQEWARLAAALWGAAPGELLAEWQAGRLPNEYLYYQADGGEALAFLSLALRHDYVEGTSTSPVGYVEGIYVAPAFRGKGIARELIAFAGEWARQKGCSELASDAEATNTGSIAFHQKAGFAVANTVVCFTMKLAGPENKV